jgi:hypothetical protein
MNQYRITYSVVYVDETTYTGLCHIVAESAIKATALFWKTGAAFTGESDNEIAEIKEIRLVYMTSASGAIDSIVEHFHPDEMSATV